MIARDATLRFPAAATVALRDVVLGRVWTARPTLVVRDEREDGGPLLLHLAPGAVCYMSSNYRRGGEGEDRSSALGELASGEWTLVPTPWAVNRTVMWLWEDSRPYSVWMNWNLQTDAFAGWYVNIQVPIRVRGGFVDTRDLGLDLVVRSDMTFAWKDEDEVALAHALGAFSDADVALISDAQGAVIEHVNSGLPPFDDASIGVLSRIHPLASSLDACDGWEHA